MALAAAAVPACGGATYRQVHPTEPIAVATEGLRAAVTRIFLTDDTIENGVRDGAALVVELALANPGGRPYVVPPSSMWCLMQLDVRRPDETRLLPPSEDGEGPFPGMPPEDGDLQPIVVAPGQSRTAWILFRGYRFEGSDAPRRIVLRIPDTAGRSLELVLADPAQGELRWAVPPTRSTWTIGLKGGSLYGGYVQATSASTSLSRAAIAGPFLWDVGLVSTTLVQVQGLLRSSSSSFTGIGLDAHLALPLLQWGDTTAPIRLGPYLGGQLQTLLAIQPTPKQNPPPAIPVYGEGGPEVGLELDVGALRNAATPFPLTPAVGNVLPRWSLRLGYAHAWIGHGAADGYYSGLRLAW